MSVDHDSRNRSKITFAVGGVFLLLGVAFAAAMWTGHEDPVPESIHSTEADRLAALAAPFSLNLSQAAMAVPEHDLQSGLNLSADAVLSGHGFAVADAGQYTMGAQETAIAGTSGGHFAWSTMTSNASIAGPSIRSDTDADGAIVEGEAVLAQVAALWAGGDVQAMLDGVDGAGAEHGVLVPGLVRSPLGASHAAQPDDSAATEGRLHAEAVLSVMEGGYGDLAAGLDAIHAAQSGLPMQLQGAFQEADAFATATQSSLDAQHEARAAAIVDQALDYEAGVHAAAKAHAEATVAARAASLASVDAWLDGQYAALDEAAAAAHGDVDAQLQSIHGEADARLAELDRLESDAVATEMTAAHTARLDTMAEVRASIEDQRGNAMEAVAEAHAAIDAQHAVAVAEVEERAASARQDIQQRADEALAWGDAREVALIATVDAAVATALELESEAHGSASASVDSMVEARKQLLREQALKTVAQARSEADKAQRLVATVQEDAATEVGHDLAVILAVAEDHRAVPTPEREAAADAWMQVHALLEAGLEQELIHGFDILVKADAVLEAAAQAEAAL